MSVAEFVAPLDLRGRALAVLGVIALSSGALAGCGGSGSKSTSTHGAVAAHSSSTPGGGAGGGASVSTGPVRGSLSAPNHAPVVGKGWIYSVKVADPSGKPLTGTVDIEFLFAGQIVGRDSPPTHPVKHGTWRDTLTFPAQAVGEPLTLQAVVHTSQGSIKLDWPVTVKR